MNVGVRELRDSLSKRLAEVRAGSTITVTDHGKPIARIVPVEGPTKYEQLVAEGFITPAKRPKGPAPKPVVKGPVSDLIAEQRR